MVENLTLTGALNRKVTLSHDITAKEQKNHFILAKFPQLLEEPKKIKMETIYSLVYYA